MSLTTAHKWISWWSSKISLCRSNPTTLQPVSCTDFEPRDWKDCLWNAGFESLGEHKIKVVIREGFKHASRCNNAANK
jgi:hypothetical protein